MSGLGFIAQEVPTACETCGIIAECRPYGMNYEQICFNCAMEDKETTVKRMDEYLLGIKNSED